MSFVETFAMASGERVRAGQSIRVVLAAYSRDALGAAARELRRHVRLAALAGFILPMETGPLPSETAAGVYEYTATGYTWRPAGSEYTVSELAVVVAAAYSAAGGRGSMTVRVFQLAGAASSVLGGFDALDPRSGGAVDRAGETGGRAIEGVVGAVEGIGSAAQGIGGAASAFGEGAAAVGTEARNWPLLTFLALTSLALAFAWRKS